MSDQRSTSFRLMLVPSEPTEWALLSAICCALLLRWNQIQPIFWISSCILLLRWVSPERRYFRVRSAVPAVLLATLSLSSLLWVDDLSNGVRATTNLLGFIVLSVYVATFLESDHFVGYLRTGTLITMVASTAGTIFLPTLTAPDTTGAMRGIFTHKNWLALAACIFLLTLIYSRVARRAKLISGLYALSVLVMSESWGSRIALLSAVLAAEAISRSRSRATLPLRYVFIALAMVAIGASARAIRDAAYGALVAGGKEISTERRLDLWRVTLGFWGQRPLFGWGYRGSWDRSVGVARAIVDQMGGFPARSAHNAYVDLLLQVGAVGVVLVMSMLIGSLIKLGRQSRHELPAKCLLSVVVLCGVFSISESFLAGHVGLLVVLLGWLMGSRVRLSDRFGANRQLNIEGSTEESAIFLR